MVEGLARESMYFIVTNKFVWRFCKHLRGKAITDEHFYSTLSSITKVENLRKKEMGQDSDGSRSMLRVNVQTTILVHMGLECQAFATL